MFEDNVVVAVFGVSAAVMSCVLALLAAPRRFAAISPVFLFALYYTVRTVPGNIAVGIELDTLRVILVPSLGLVMLAVGGIMGNAFGLRGRERSGQQSLGALRIYRRPLVFARVFIIAGLAACAVYFYMSGAVPLWYGVSDLLGLGGAPSSMHAARRAITAGHRDGEVAYFGQGYLRAVYFQFMPIGVLLLALSRRLRHGSYGTGVVIIGVVTLLVQLLSGQRWPVMQVGILFVVSTVVFSARLQKHSRGMFGQVLNGRTIAAIALLLLLFVGFTGMQRVSGRTSVDASIATDIINRVSVSRTGLLYQIFPFEQPFRYGSTWVNDMRGFLPGLTRTFRYEVHQLIHGGSYGYTLSPTLFGSMYVNFGIPGIIFFSLMLGFIVQVVGMALALSTHLSDIVIYGYFASGMMFASTSDMTSVVFVLLVTAFLWTMFRFSASDRLAVGTLGMPVHGQRIHT